MNALVKGLEHLFAALPLSLLEVWGQFGYLTGAVFMLCAFGGVTLRPGGRWGLGLERQVWDSKALLSIPITFLLIFITGYIGSSIVLVPGAQTFESLKDLSVFLCIVLFGFPALLIVPFAYGLSDLIEGVPPDFLQDWLLGYFINPACFWLAYQLIGHNPDFRQARTWGGYLVFILIFMSIEPQLWGFICADKFTAEISYRTITPALFFTTAVTWILAPVAMLVALPLARQLGLFWADIPFHVRQRALDQKDWHWVNSGLVQDDTLPVHQGVPLRMFLLAPFILLVLMMVGATANVTLQSAERGATRLAQDLQQTHLDALSLRLDQHLASGSTNIDPTSLAGALQDSTHPEHGKTLVFDARLNTRISSSHAPEDPVIERLAHHLQNHGTIDHPYTFKFDVVTAKPLSHETWLGQATPYTGPQGAQHWLLVNAMPAAYFLAGVRVGNSQSATVFAISLLLSLVVAALLAALVTAPLRRLVAATQALANGDLAQRVPGSRLEEFDSLAQGFNYMGTQLQESFTQLLQEVEIRKHREQELEQSESRVRTSEERLKLATRAASLGVWDWDVENDILVWDDAMYHIYGVPRERFAGALEAWSVCVVPEDLPAATAEVQAALKGEKDFDTEFRIRWADGSPHLLKGVAKVIRNPQGKPVRMVGMNYDITRQKQAEQELLQHRNHLEELVNDRTNALSVAVAQAQAANTAKSTFLANMSHELRTPLNVILGYCTLLQREVGLNATQREKLTIIGRSGEHLLRLINDVLDMSKIESGRMQLTPVPFDLRALITDIASMMRARTEEKGLELRVELSPLLPAVICADEGKLRQILINLLGNAIKNTASGTVTLRLNLLATAPRLRVRLDVEDSGIGISSEDQARIFDAFVQGGQQAQQSGTGLGLTISQEFARMMGGQIHVSSTPGHGSLFWLEFDAAPAHADEIAEARPDNGVVTGLAPGQPRIRVLVVEDQPESQSLLSNLLVQAGFEVEVAADGVEAVDLFQRQPHDFIWMDLRMPRMDGFEATRRIRALPGGDRVKIVAVSASVFHEEREQVFASGMNGFVHKPFRPAGIYTCMAEHLGIRYEYEPDTRDGSAPTAPPSPLLDSTALPTALRDALEAALVRLDAAQITAVIAQIAQNDAALAQAMTCYAENFDYTPILNALKLPTGKKSG